MKNIIKENLVDIEDDMDEAYEKECLVYLIKELCDYLDWLSSFDIEEKLNSSKCYFSGGCYEDLIERMIIIEEQSNNFGVDGLKLLYQLEEKHSGLAAVNYDKEKGFSKTQRWCDFVVLVNTVNLFFKDILKQPEWN
jgi:hypothetical protein